MDDAITDDGPRFWIVDPESPPGVNWVGVVDEKRGGIIAYFGDESEAIAFIAMLNIIIDASTFLPSSRK